MTKKPKENWELELYLFDKAQAKANREYYKRNIHFPDVSHIVNKRFCGKRKNTTNRE